MYSNDTRAFFVIDPINKLSNYTMIDNDLDKVWAGTGVKLSLISNYLILNIFE